MKIFLILLLGSILTISTCETNDKAIINETDSNSNLVKKNIINNNEEVELQDTINYYIPKFALKTPNYHLLNEEELNKFKIIQSKLINLNGNFLGDTDENDIIGHPDLDYDNLKIWVNGSKRKKITFYAKKISKGYGFYYDNNKLLLVTESLRTTEGLQMDSIFFDDNIFFWKNSKNNVVIDQEIINGKDKYLQRLSKEIDEVYRNELGFVEQYVIKNDSLSSFVILNLK